MITRSKGAFALAFVSLGIWASSSSYAAHANTSTNPEHTTTYVFAESADNGSSGLTERWDFAGPSDPYHAETQPEVVPAPAAEPAQGATPVVLLPTSTKYSFLAFGRSGLPARWNPCSTLTWRIDFSGVPKGFSKKVFKRTAVESMRQIRKATGLPIKLSSDVTTVPSILVKFAQTKDMPGEDVLGYAGVAVSSDNAEIVHVDIVLDGSAPRRNDILWLGWKNVVLHEMGHAVGLSHAEDSSQVMFAYATTAEKFLRGDLTALHVVGATNGCLNH